MSNGDIFWGEDITRLFCSLSPVPSGNISSPERLNSITRLVLYITVLMVSMKFKYTVQFFALCMLFIFLIYFNVRDLKIERENYTFLSSPINNMSYNSINNNLVAAKSNINSTTFTKGPDVKYPANTIAGPKDKVEYASRREVLEQMNAYKDLQNRPLYSASGNSYFGNSELALKSANYDFERGKRDNVADIQYFYPSQGVNRRTMIEPVIAPHSYAMDYWGENSTNIDRVNRRNYTDITESDPDREYIDYIPRVEGSVMMMNNVEDGEYTDKYGYYGSGQLYYGSTNKIEYDENIKPIYNEFYKKISYDNNKMSEQNSYNTTLSPSSQTPDGGDFITPNEDTRRFLNHSIKGGKVRERFAFPDNPLTNNKNDGHPNKFKDSNMVQNLYQSYGNVGKGTPVDSSYNILDKGVDSTVPRKSTTVTDSLLNASPTFVYNEEFFNRPDRKVYLQDLQPKLYSWEVDQTPINGNIGITYTPQRPPKIMDQVRNTHLASPLYTRIDPQLIREDGTEGQQAINPIRNDWSANYSSWNAPPGSIDFENIYDPRFSSYGDPYRSYSDVNLGQVRYYYSDVDAYTQPNFVIRSNVDFMDYRTPQNQEWPQYERTASLDDVKPYVESQTTADELYHREDIMSSLMSKRNRESWQLKQAPLRRAANSNMPFGPT